MKPHVLALDIGSSSLRSAFFDEGARRLDPTSATRQYSIRYTEDEGGELDAAVLLLAARDALAQTRAAGYRAKVEVICASAFWHGLLGLDRRGRPLTPIFMWADTRSAPEAAQMREEFSERRVQLRTGCMLRAPFWPAKLRWLRRTQPALFARVARWSSPSSWIFENLLGVNATSHSMASGTGLYHLQRRTWDEELCAACGVELEQLGPIADHGLTKDGAQVFTAIGDGAAGNLGSGADQPRKAAINIGTSAAVRLVMPRGKIRPPQLPFGLFKYVVDADRVVLGGALSNGGNLHRWSMRELQIGDAPAAERALDRTAAASDPLTVLPFWVQERAPTWPVEIRGTIAGLTAASSAAEILRATKSAIFYRLAAITDSLEETFGPLTDLIVSGGVLHSPAALRILADALGRDLTVSPELESSLRGAVVHARQQLGLAPVQLSLGRRIAHRAALTLQHRERRVRQEELERRLS